MKNESVAALLAERLKAAFAQKTPVLDSTRAEENKKMHETLALELGMTDLSKPVTDLPPEQEAIRATCCHPSGTFVEFEREELGQSITERFRKSSDSSLTGSR